MQAWVTEVEYWPQSHGLLISLVFQAEEEALVAPFKVLWPRFLGGGSRNLPVVPGWLRCYWGLALSRRQRLGGESGGAEGTDRCLGGSGPTTLAPLESGPGEQPFQL